METSELPVSVLTNEGARFCRMSGREIVSGSTPKITMPPISGSPTPLFFVMR